MRKTIVMMLTLVCSLTAKADAKETAPQPEECTSIQCDGINYAFLTSK